MRFIFLAALTLSAIVAASDAVYAGCRTGSPGPDIIPCPPDTWTRVQRPTCHPDHQVYEITGHLDYWNEFMSPVQQPCELEIEYHGADLAEAGATWQQQSQCFCPAKRVLIWPYYAQTRTSTQHIGGQMDYHRRRFLARGCYIDAEATIFVANYIGYNLND